LHEVAGGGNGAIDGAAAALFAAGIAARVKGKTLWCLTRPDLFAPAIAQAGLGPDRVIYVEAGDEKSVLACFEEGLRHGGLGSVVAEVSRLSMTGSRRLQLAAESSGTIGLALRRWRRQTDASDFGQPTAASTRWRVSVLPSRPLPVPGVGRHRWLVELIRARAGESADFELEACDDKGRLGLPSNLVHGQVSKEIGRRIAAA
jgi:protein ImuA